MVGIKLPSLQKIWRFNSACFCRKVISETNNLWYNDIKVLCGCCTIGKEQNTNHTYANLAYISKTNLIFFYGRCKVMHHAYFCRYQQGTVASFLNPDLTNKPWDVHFYCVLMALREYLFAYDLP